VDGALADSHYTTRLKLQMVRQWRHLAVQKQELATLEAEYEAKRRVSTKSAVFAKWRKRLALVSAEEQVLLMKEKNLLSKAWETWRIAT
jgi:hypothetical protein